MSFDPGVYDPQVFGSAQSDSCLFDGAVFDSAIFDVCVEDEVVEEAPQEQRLLGRGFKPRRARPRYWWEKDEREEAVVQVEPPAPKTFKDFGELGIMLRTPFQAAPQIAVRKTKQRKLAMIAALLDE